MLKATRGQRMDTVFVLIIFSIFAISVLIVLMLGAGIYRRISDISHDGADERTVLSYIWTKTKNFNEADMLSVTGFHGENALAINEVLGGTEYQTLVYHHDGWLCELFTEKGLGLSPQDGVRVMRLESISFESLEHGLIRVTTGGKSLLISPLSG